MEPKGSKIGIVFNGSPLFTGDAGSGESEIRKWIMENDLLECIIQLPNRMFFNTGIPTYIWILTNNKSLDRKGKTQLIDATLFFTSMRKNLGDKGKYIADNQTKELKEIYLKNKENKFCKIFDNTIFGYTKVIVEQPLLENGKVKKDKDGNIKADTKKRDSERIPLSDDIDEHFNREVKKHIPDSWMDRSKDKIGYEINFTKYFYKFESLRDTHDILQDLKNLNEEINQLSVEIND
jgi:type I restriction enzyme M protein